ncbi:hypothetical protein LH128_15401 [Sphingomonas sp. LH128]|uniref:DUF2958 domain-containing protein n=1 Tax=Sphingomonas sp. LH128 TaxID=473781 RepID=UPI00027CB1F0|nr:DUF2958 domain-containing protein [Sphingomonas sp. LH128]EJU12125.1 hypothetical protein LH128_15401 [Sphingomonas sp. LH128]
MILLTPELRAVLRANAIATHAAQAEGRREPDPFPVVKLFNPCGAATWLATELDDDDRTLFGLADLGFGSPELGYFDLAEIEAVRLPGGLGIERDLYFTARFPLSAYAEAARIAGRITEAEALLSTVARARQLRTPRNPEIPRNPHG